ncbi:phosphatidylinositol glycan class O [Capsaspora owczarzaki ATCC 30864]|uniref:Phosphatidylinositol glycan class O n=1 Tax=Capsaspora owczarzaki (strain ATCC 30864) TaxID=595528 RepID=A0A0D2U8S2_CAPO3|nr:phosphatidylinositol glycan class O [Capsaspora owczarzaki ATCC 30864]KJE91471.1 phosphatidylinositol glycan class O [Capsaspora owczarzaki ATCC 30864]|eukprot:XP_004349352.1 phosphatidylinositol glycan class O [Capsaspora owczarzaki ATCC 30864]
MHRLQRWSPSLATAILLLVHAAAIALFARGFLLARIEVPNRSSSDDFAQLRSAFAARQTGGAGDDDQLSERLIGALDDRLASDKATSLPKQNDPSTRGWLDGDGASSQQQQRQEQDHPALILIVIDALRYDFAAPCEPTAPSHSDDAQTSNIPHARFPPCDPQAPYTGHLTAIRDKLAEHPNRARLFRFRADPPTTTLQRLKGLTTGSLPTFVDAGSNFASGSIGEDNWIDQLAESDKSSRARTGPTSTPARNGLLFLGDDTWMNLFPRSFRQAHPFPSFNVHDLHTVDHGVEQILLPLLQQRNYQTQDAHDGDNSENYRAIVAHFLGVDHAGHTFGPYVPAINAKLHEMNGVIREAIAAIDHNPRFKDTLLVVCGDHGMTREGDHGGDSLDETDAALFVYSTRGWAPPQLASEGLASDVTTVRQIDLVPTLSLLLGIPIPFGNLGAAIPELLPANLETRDWWLTLNAVQVHRYMLTYASVSSDLSPSTVAAIRKQLEHAHRSVWTRSQQQLPHWVDVRTHPYYVYLQTVQELCRETWARFDTNSMQLGIALAVVSALPLLAVVFVLAPVRLHDLPAFVLTAILLFGTTSNSFVVNESFTFPFAFALLVLLALGQCISHSMTMRGFKPLRPIAWAVAGLVLLRLCLETCLVCREEQSSPQCASLQQVQPGTFVYDYAFTLTFGVPCLLWLLYACKTRDWARRNRSMLFCAVLCGLLLWAGVETDIQQHNSQVAGLQQGERNNDGVAAGSLWWVNAAIRLLYGGLMAGLLVLRFARQVHSKYILSGIYICCSLWAGRYFAIAVLYCGLSIFCLGAAVRALHPPSAPRPPTSVVSSSAVPGYPASSAAINNTVAHSWTLPVLLWLGGWTLFFSIGHQKTFSTLRWTAPFVGFDDADMVRSGTMIFLEAFAGMAVSALGAVALPKAFASFRSTTVAEPPLRLLLQTHTIHHLHLIIVLVTAMMHRRHLMAWKIFAPNFLFSAAAILAFDVFALFFGQQS